MQVPKTSFWQEPKAELVSLVKTLSNIINGFYLRHNFLVLPSLPEKFSKKTALLPPLPYAYFPNFWQEVKSWHYGQKLRLVYSRPKHSIALVPVDLPGVKFVEYHLRLSRILSFSSQKIEKLWRAREEKFWQLIDKILPFVKKLPIENIDVFLVQWGTIWFASRFPQQKSLVVIARADAKPGDLAAGIILSLILWEEGITSHQENLWSERTAIVEFLLSKTPLAELFPNYRPLVLASTSGVAWKRLQLETLQFLKSTGVPLEEILKLKVEKEAIKFQETPLDFSPQEERVFRLLYRHRGEFVTLEEIAKNLWGEGWWDKYNPNTIAKIIQRLRAKLAQQQQLWLIETKNKVGYRLVL